MFLFDIIDFGGPVMKRPPLQQRIKKGNQIVDSIVRMEKLLVKMDGSSSPKVLSLVAPVRNRLEKAKNEFSAFKDANWDVVPEHLFYGTEKEYEIYERRPLPVNGPLDALNNVSRGIEHMVQDLYRAAKSAIGKAWRWLKRDAAAGFPLTMENISDI